MKFSELLKKTNINFNIKPNNDFIVSGITDDSRKIKENFVYIASANDESQNTKFIQEAIKLGAKFILSKHQYKDNPNVIKIDDIDHVKSIIGSVFYPHQPDHIFAVTGTNGKTSTVHFIRQILSLLNQKAASIGTLGIYIGYNDKSLDIDTKLTTPGGIELHYILDQLYHDKINYLAMEASSHGLDQHRLDRVKIQVAGFTNFSQDHLDYHKDMEEYFQAKMRLFRDLLPSKSIAVLNSEIKEYDQILSICNAKNHQVFTYGKNAKDAKIIELIPTEHGIKLDLDFFGKNYKLDLPLIGTFQVYNILCAGLMVAANQNKFDIAELFIKLSPVPGRMEKVHHQKAIYVDYSHKPEALETAIKVLRAHTKGKIILVFGCGGDRDSLKRPIMGDIAARFADYSFITDDNPRTEDPTKIRKQIIEGYVKSGNKNFQEIPSREEAIHAGISMATDHDIVLIAGKGHEKYQIIGNETIFFDDVLCAEKA